MKLKDLEKIFFISFLPRIYQEKFKGEENFNFSYLTSISAFFTILISLLFGFSFYGFYKIFNFGIFWFLFINFLFFIVFLDGFIRLILNLIFKKSYGSLPFYLFEKYISKMQREKIFNDDILELENSLIIHTPCPKPHWVLNGGLNFKGKNYKLKKYVKLEPSNFYRFELSNLSFPLYDLEKEKNFNISSDLAFIFAPLWAFLSEKYQYSLLKFERHNFINYFYFSIFLTFFVFFPSLIFDVVRILQKREVFYFIIPHLALCIYFVHESLLRFVTFKFERRIKGSLIAFFIKPLYYMAYGEFQ